MTDYLHTTYSNKYGVLFNFEKIIYNKDLPVILPIPISEGFADFMSQLTNKLDSWKYEDEYRILAMDGSNFIATLPNEFFSELYLGYKMKEETCNHIIKLIKSKIPNMKIFKIDKDLYDFKLSRIEIR